MKILGLLKYNDGTGEKEVRIQQQIVPKWMELATQLGFKPELIETWSERGSQHATITMMHEWLRVDTEHSWGKLVQKMKDAGLGTSAADLKYALCYMATQISRDKI